MDEGRFCPRKGVQGAVVLYVDGDRATNLELSLNNVCAERPFVFVSCLLNRFLFVIYECK